MQTARPHAPFWPDLHPGTEIGEKLLASTPLYLIGKVAEKLLSIDRLNELYAESRRKGEDVDPEFANAVDG
jgi:hypothetical protein